MKNIVDDGVTPESIDDNSVKMISLEEINIDDGVISGNNDDICGIFISLEEIGAVDMVEVPRDGNGETEENSGVSISTDVRSIAEDGRVRIEVDVLKKGVKILMNRVSSELDIGSSMFLEELRIVGSGTSIDVVEGAINTSEDNIEVGSKKTFEVVIVSTGTKGEVVCTNIDDTDVGSIGTELEVCVTNRLDVLIVSIGIKIEVGSMGSKRDVLSGKNRKVVNNENVVKLVVKI